MQKSLHKCLTLLHHIANFQTNQIYFCSKEQDLKYKLCIKHIFLERILVERNGKNQLPLKNFLQLRHHSVSYSELFSFVNI